MFSCVPARARVCVCVCVRVCGVCARARGENQSLTFLRVQGMSDLGTSCGEKNWPSPTTWPCQMKAPLRNLKLSIDHGWAHAPPNRIRLLFPSSFFPCVFWSGPFCPSPVRKFFGKWSGVVTESALSTIRKNLHHSCLIGGVESTPF